MARNRKQPKHQRQAGYFDTNAKDAISKAIARKNKRMMRQGKPSPGFVRPDYFIQERGQPRVGVQIGKIAFIFELRGNEPIVVSSQKKGWGIVTHDNSYVGVARLREEFAGLPKVEREAVLNKVRAELYGLLRETPPEERKLFLKSQEEFRTMKPQPGHIGNVESGLKYSRTVGELDVVWEFWSRNETIRKKYYKVYQKKRTELQK